MRPTGPIPASIAIVGEAPGFEEERAGVPFVGASGRLLTSALAAAGLSRGSCFLTNVCRLRPLKNDISEWFSENKKAPHPDWKFVRGRWVHPAIAAGLPQLRTELLAVKPRVIIALGNTALWALTTHTGILKWRGSRLWSDEYNCIVLPTVHPAAVLRQMELQVPFQVDLQRAKNLLEGRQTPRKYTFAVPTPGQAFENEDGHTITPLPFSRAIQLLDDLARIDKPTPVACDIETARGYIDCIGFASTVTSGFCLPFLSRSPGGLYQSHWSLDEETILRLRIAELFRHPHILWVGQNFLYDCQYFFREAMGYPRRVFDTMIGHHAIFSNLRKSLDFLSSFYAHDHVYWKDELKEAAEDIDQIKRWIYNGKDCCITLECYHGIHSQFAKENAK